MPNRIVRQGMNDSRAVNSLSFRGELFYRRLMLIADDYGRFDADVTLLRPELFKRQLDAWTEGDVQAALFECAAALTSEGPPLVELYEVKGKLYLELWNFGQRIRVDKKGKPTPSKFPAPDAALRRGSPLLAALRGGNPRVAAVGGESPHVAAERGGSPPEAESAGVATVPVDRRRRRRRRRRCVCLLPKKVLKPLRKNQNLL